MSFLDWVTRRQKPLTEQKAKCSVNGCSNERTYGFVVCDTHRAGRARKGPYGVCVCGSMLTHYNAPHERLECSSCHNIYPA